MTTEEIRLEEDRLDRKHVALTAIVALAIMIFSIWLAWILLVQEEEGISAGAAPIPSRAGERQISGVRQTLIARDLEGIHVRREATQDLERYRWVDREKGTISIPIRRAMELVAEGEKP